MAQTVISADPDNDDAKRGLAEVYEILGETRKALNLVNQGAWTNSAFKLVFSYRLSSDRCTWEARYEARQTEYSGQPSEYSRDIIVRRDPILETDQGAQVLEIFASCRS